MYRLDESPRAGSALESASEDKSRKPTEFDHLWKQFDEHLHRGEVLNALMDNPLPQPEDPATPPRRPRGSQFRGLSIFWPCVI